MPSAAPADLGETESVSEDELPPDSEKKRKAAAKASGKIVEKKVKVETGGMLIYFIYFVYRLYSGENVQKWRNILHTNSLFEKNLLGQKFQIYKNLLNGNIDLILKLS